MSLIVFFMTNYRGYFPLNLANLLLNTFLIDKKRLIVIHPTQKIIYQSRLGSDRIQPYLVQERSVVYLDCLVTLSLTDSLIYFLPGMLTDQKWSFVINFLLTIEQVRRITQIILNPKRPTILQLEFNEARIYKNSN